jgi:putative oxidoreductase
LAESPHHYPRLLIDGAAGLFLFAGLWTPFASGVAAIIGLWEAFWRSGDPWSNILLVILGVGLAMLGPGVWSVDARLFGRKRIRIPDR